jgi:hypothetical protein
MNFSRSENVIIRNIFFRMTEFLKIITMIQNTNSFYEIKNGSNRPYNHRHISTRVNLITKS